MRAGFTPYPVMHLTIDNARNMPRDRSEGAAAQGNVGGLKKAKKESKHGLGSERARLDDRLSFEN